MTPSPAYMDACYNDAMEHGWSKTPTFDMFIPSIYDASLAPAGKHVMSLFCQHFNPNLPDGRSWDEAKAEAVETIINKLSEVIEDFRDIVEGYVL